VATGNDLNVGVYARVLRGGIVSRGQTVALDRTEEGTA
jgi:MOSC domain-containing protein YiiM